MATNNSWNSQDPAQVAFGGTGVQTMTTAYAPVCAGTTATAPLQVASTGQSNSGWVLTSTGSSSLPTFQAPAATAFVWTVIPGATQVLVANNGYIANNAGTTVFTLPATAAVGDTFRVTGKNNATGWSVAQNASQTIYFGTVATTTGVAGSLASTATRDAIEIVCVTTNNDFQVISSIGNITYA